MVPALKRHHCVSRLIDVSYKIKNFNNTFCFSLSIFLSLGIFPTLTFISWCTNILFISMKKNLTDIKYVATAIGMNFPLDEKKSSAQVAKKLVINY
jgi:hypothetical protein